MKSLCNNIVACLPALFAAVILCGCQSITRSRFDINPATVQSVVASGVGGPYVVVEIRRFSSVEFACNLTSRKNYPCREVVPGTELMPELSRLFPEIFADTPDAVPIIVMQNVRSGSVASPSGMQVFDGASGFNKNLSRSDRSDMAPHVGLFVPLIYLNSLVSLCTLGIVPAYFGGYSSHYEISVMTGYDAYGGNVAYSAGAGLWIANPVTAALFPEAAGWRRKAVEVNTPIATPDATEGQKRTALCCAIAAALAKLSPEERAALRRNPVALLRDKETGGKRAFRLVQVTPERETAEMRMGERGNRPRILSQAYDPATRVGYVFFDTSACADAKAAIIWVKESYIPLVASQKAVALVASPMNDRENDVPLISVTGFKKEDAGECRIDFTVLE